jgi:ubiquinone/menaquinone biosynthesis C-methylase UbiE
MELDTAVRLIEKGITGDKGQSWTDLGAGNGFFTNALSRLLPKGSSITAIDKTFSTIKVADGIQLITKTSDFTNLQFDNSDGILMANSLHYVKDQSNFLKLLKGKTRRLVVVEYNTDRGNTWVPYPINFLKLQSIAKATLLATAPSQYHKEGIYSALILF